MRQRLAAAGDGGCEPVVPGARDVGDARFECCHIDVLDGPFVPPDDEVHADQRTLGEERRERRQPALIGFAQQLPDLLADGGREAIALDINQHRDEAIEPVTPCEHPNARPQFQVDDTTGPLQQPVFADLKQLVARECLQHVCERFAGVAPRREPGLRNDMIDLVPQKRNLPGRLRVGLAREQANQSQFAIDRAVAAVGLQPNAIHVNPPVNAGHDVRLDDHQWLRRGRKLGDLRRHRDCIAVAGQHMHTRVTQDAETAAFDRDQPITGEPIRA